MHESYYVGADLGQVRDYSTISLLERIVVAGEFDPVMRAYPRRAELRLRHLERMPLQTPYPEVVRRVRDVARQPHLLGKCRVAVDATGVGRPVLDMLERAELGSTIMPVMFTGGLVESRDGGIFMVPKRDLILNLQLMLQTSELRVAAGLSFGEELVKEMTEMEVRVSPSGHEKFAAWREGQHDDLVFAVALACWAAKKLYPNREEGWCAWAPDPTTAKF